jgi:hypothetical protein
MSDYIREAFDSDNAAQKNIALRKASNEIWFLRAENERLRGALRQFEDDLNVIRDDLIADRESDNLVSWAARVERAIAPARAALEEKK